MALAVEFAVADSKGCPVARASDDAGQPVTDVSRASLTRPGPVTEEFRLPESAAVETAAAPVATAGGETVYRFERDPDRDCVCEVIERIAGPATDVRAEDGALVVATHLEDLATVQSVVESLRTVFDGVSVARLRDLDAEAGDPPPSGEEFDPTAQLTDRQREVVRTAHEMGYFGYPKGANAGEVAAELDISRSTFAEHLAAAQRKLLRDAFGPDVSR